MKTKKTALAGVWGAVVFLLTYFVRIPTAMGYVHAGDAAVLLSGVWLGGLPGAAASAIGSVMADILAGYVMYAPVTFLVKGGMALLSLFVYRLSRHRSSAFSAVLSGLAGEGLMLCAYFFYEWLLYGFGGAVAGLSGNTVQGLASVILYCLIVRSMTL